MIFFYLSLLLSLYNILGVYKHLLDGNKLIVLHIFDPSRVDVLPMWLPPVISYCREGTYLTFRSWDETVKTMFLKEYLLERVCV